MFSVEVENLGKDFRLKQKMICKHTIIVVNAGGKLKSNDSESWVPIKEDTYSDEMINEDTGTQHKIEKSKTILHLIFRARRADEK